MERETKKVTTPVGKVEVTLNTYLTGGDKLDVLKAGQDNMVDVLLGTLVVAPSIEDIKNLHGKDFDFLLFELREISDQSSWEAKKKI